MDFFGILYDMKNGKKVPYSKTYFDTLFAAKLAEMQIKTLTGTLPLTFRTSETALRSWTIYGNNTQHKYSTSGTLPLTFTTHTAGAASDWVIEGNDHIGKNVIRLGESQSRSGVTLTIDRQAGTAILNGDTTEAGSGFSLNIFETSSLAGGDYIFSGGADGGSSTKYDLFLYNYTDQVYIGRLYNSNDTIATTIESGKLYRVYIQCRRGQTYNNIVFKPMLRPANTSPEFEPYTVGVGERTTNLFDKANCGLIRVDQHGTTRFGSIMYGVENGEYTLACDNQAGVALYLQTLTNGTYTLVNVTSLLPYTFTVQDIDALILRSTATQDTDWDTLGVYDIMLVEGGTAPQTYIPYGYEIPIAVNNTTQDIYIGRTPLTAGQSISKTSTGVDIAAIAGSNTITTELYNKPSMSIEGVDYVGVGEPVNDSWQIPLTVTHYTDNIFDKDAKNANKGYEDSTCIMWAGSIPYPYMTGNIPEDNNCFVSEKIPASPNTTYYLTDGIFKNTDNGIYSVFLWNRFRMSDYQAFPTEKTFTTGDDTKFIQLCVLKSYADTVMITTKPTETYIPHVEVNNVNVPINAPLTEGQSVTDTQTINTFEGENVLDTTLENKPQMSITYKGG